MMLLAPAILAPWIAPEPTPPQPTTTTVSPGRTLARSTAAPNPVESPQLMSAAARRLTPSSIFTTEPSFTTIYSENVPSWHIRLRSSSPRWWR